MRSLLRSGVAWLRLGCLALGTALVGAVPSLEWRWSNPNGSGAAVNALAWRTNRLFLAVGERGQLRVGTEPASLRTVPSGTTKSLRAAAYLGNRAVVVGESGTVAWSDDDRFQAVETGRTNWLEGLAASADRLVAVGDAGMVMVSTNGVAWTAGSVGATNWLRAVAFGSGVFLAVGESGFVASSPDGVAWTRLAAGRTTAHLNAVTPTSTGFLAVGDNGTVLASRTTQLTQWDASRITTTTLPLTAVLATSATERLVAGAGGLWFGVQVANAFVWSSEVTGLRSSPAPATEYLGLVSDGTRVLAGTRYEGVAVGVRSLAFAGYSWTHDTPVGSDTVWDAAPVVAEGTNVVATMPLGVVVLTTNTAPSVSLVTVGERAQFLDSPDGRTWNRGLAPASATNTDYLGIAARARLALAVGSGGAVARSLPEFQSVVSTNAFTNGATVTTVVLTNRVNLLGIAWDAVSSGVTNDLQGVALTDSLAVAVGSAGMILTSPDGAAWTPRISGTTGYLSSVTAWPGGFVASGAGGAVVTSPDGIRWTPASLGAGWLWRVRWLQDRLVAVGQSGRMLVSTNATTWTPVATGTDVWWNDVAFSSGTWFLAGDSGTVGVSTNLVDWTVAEAPTSRAFYSAAILDDRLVVAGTAGGILRARIAPWTQPVRLLSFPKTPDENLFLFGGEPDQAFVFERSSDLATWSEASPMEITDPNGILLLLDTATNAPATQFFRTRTP